MAHVRAGQAREFGHEFPANREVIRELQLQFTQASHEVSFYSLERSRDHEHGARNATPNQQGIGTALSGTSEGQNRVRAGRCRHGCARSAKVRFKSSWSAFATSETGGLIPSGRIQAPQVRQLS
jgi:hypothetical protein